MLRTASEMKLGIRTQGSRPGLKVVSSATRTRPSEADTSLNPDVAVVGTALEMSQRLEMQR